MSGERNFYLEAKYSSQIHDRPRAPRGRTVLRALDIVDDRIIVCRGSASAFRQLPPWLVRGFLTTVVIATIGFSLQHLLMPSYGDAKDSGAAYQWASSTPGADVVGMAPLSALTPEQQALQPISRQAAIALNNSIPFSSAPTLAAAPFSLAGASEQDRDRAIGCLAEAIYYEAGGDTVDDQRAVAQVVLNRVRHPLFPKTVCGVVFQGSQLRTGCQFTFTCDGSMSRVPDARAWARAQVMAAAALNGAVFTPVGYATHFHTPSVAPYWAPTLEKIIQVGGHLFYRWPGGSGAPRAFMARYAGGETAGVGVGGGLATDAASVATASAAPAPPPETPTEPVRKVEVAAIDLPLAPPAISERAVLVAGPPPIVLSASPRLDVRTYHPPIPRGGSAQPLFSRDR